MLGTIVDVEYDRYLRVEAAGTERREIWFGVIDQPVSADGHWPVDEKERFHAPLGVGPCMAQLGPALVRVLYFETNSDTTRGRPPGRIEYVG